MMSRGQMRRGGADDCVGRRTDFERNHPGEAQFVPPAVLNGRWRAIVPPGRIPGDPVATTIGAEDLCGLMDRLEEIYPPAGVTEDGAEVSSPTPGEACRARSRQQGPDGTAAR